jgi:hypothetical protein
MPNDLILPADEALAALPDHLAKRVALIEGHLVWTGRYSDFNGGLQRYGRLKIDGRDAYAHRAVYAELNGERPRLKPTCDVELCVLHWSKAKVGPRLVRRALEVQFLEEFISYCELRLRQIRKRQLAPPR